MTAEAGEVREYLAIACKEFMSHTMRIEMYASPTCPYCAQAREYYRTHGIAFTEYDAQNDLERRREMLAYSNGDPTVPCIVEDGVFKQSGWGSPPRG